jgi:hypothetical protein
MPVVLEEFGSKLDKRCGRHPPPARAWPPALLLKKWHGRNVRSVCTKLVMQRSAGSRGCLLTARCACIRVRMRPRPFPLLDVAETKPACRVNDQACMQTVWLSPSTLRRGAPGHRAAPRAPAPQARPVPDRVRHVPRVRQARRRLQRRHVLGRHAPRAAPPAPPRTPSLALLLAAAPGAGARRAISAPRHLSCPCSSASSARLQVCVVLGFAPQHGQRATPRFQHCCPRARTPECVTAMTCRVAAGPAVPAAA